MLLFLELSVEQRGNRNEGHDQNISKVEIVIMPVMIIAFNTVNLNSIYVRNPRDYSQVSS